MRCRELDIFKLFEKLLRNVLEFLGNFWKYFRIFSEEFFWRIFLEDFFGGFFGKIFLGGFFGRIFLGGFFREEFFGRDYLVEINKELMFLSRFWGNFV